MRVSLLVIIAFSLIGMVLIGNACAAEHVRRLERKRPTQTNTSPRVKKPKLSDGALSESEADLTSDESEVEPDVDTESDRGSATESDSERHVVSARLSMSNNSNNMDLEQKSGAENSMITPVLETMTQLPPRFAKPLLPVFFPLQYWRGSQQSLQISTISNVPTQSRDKKGLSKSGRSAKSALKSKFSKNKQWASFFTSISDSEWNVIGPDGDFNINGTVLDAANGIFRCLDNSSKIKCIATLLTNRSRIGNLRNDLNRLMRSSPTFREGLEKLKFLETKPDALVVMLENMPGGDEQFLAELKKYKDKLRYKRKAAKNGTEDS